MHRETAKVVERWKQNPLLGVGSKKKSAKYKSQMIILENVPNWLLCQKGWQFFLLGEIRRVLVSPPRSLTFISTLTSLTWMAR